MCYVFISSENYSDGAARHGRSSMDHILPVISHITYNERPSGDLYFTCVVTRALRIVAH